MTGILSNFFFHNTIQLYVGVFGSVFDEIQIKRGNNKLIKVPIAYSVKKRYSVRDNQNPDPNHVRIKSQLPRMSYTMISMNRDPARMQNRLNTMVAGDRATGTVSSQRQRVPYSFQFRLDIKTKNIADMLQIMEQILVYFNPSIVVNVEDNPDLEMETAIPIRMTTTTGFADLYEGSFEDEEVIEASIEFELEGYLYMPSSSAGVITKVIVNYKDLDTGIMLDQDIILPDSDQTVVVLPPITNDPGIVI